MKKNKKELVFDKKLICVSGANGFTGKFVCQQLIKNKHKFIVILRPGDDSSWMKKEKIKVRYADLSNLEELTNALKGCHILLNIASIGFGSAKTIVKACEIKKVKRVIFISSTAIYTKLNAKSKKLRINAEKSIKESRLNWTILRPTMIFGTERDRNMIRLIKWINNLPIIPIFGNGKYLQQPIYVKDVAWAAVKVIDCKSCFNQEFNISGGTVLSFNQVIETIREVLNTKCQIIYLPKKIFILIFKLFEKINIHFPIKAEQIARLNEDKVFEYSKANKAFGFNPTSFEEGIKNQIKSYFNKIN